MPNWRYPNSGAPGRSRNAGVDNPRVKLTEATVRAIRADFGSKDKPTRKQLAKKYGMSYSAIVHIINRTTWKSLED